MLLREISKQIPAVIFPQFQTDFQELKFQMVLKHWSSGKELEKSSFTCFHKTEGS